MSIRNPRQALFLRADANALGGYLEAPNERFITTLAPVSLPVVGGSATARSDEFHLEHFVSVGAAYSSVFAKPHGPDGITSTLVQTVVERLNILNVVTADRIVAQVAVTSFPERAESYISYAGTSFQGLRIAGFACRAVLAVKSRVSPFPSASTADSSQVGQPVEPFAPFDFSVVERIELVDGGLAEFPGSISGKNTVDIPGFGRFVFGAGRASWDSLQFAAVRADLGCPVEGAVAAGSISSGYIPPKTMKKGHGGPP